MITLCLASMQCGHMSLSETADKLQKLINTGTSWMECSRKKNRKLVKPKLLSVLPHKHNFMLLTEVFVFSVLC